MKHLISLIPGTERITSSSPRSKTEEHSPAQRSSSARKVGSLAMSSEIEPPGLTPRYFEQPDSF